MCDTSESPYNSVSLRSKLTELKSGQISFVVFSHVSDTDSVFSVEDFLCSGNSAEDYHCLKCVFQQAPDWQIYLCISSRPIML